MPTNRIASMLLAAVTAVLLAGCGSGSTATQSAGVSSSSLTTTSSVTPSTVSTSASTSTSTTTSLATTSSSRTSRSSKHSRNVKPATAGGTAPNGSSSKAAPGRFTVASAAFPHGGKIPARYTCDGGNVSPPLQWGKLPAGTSQLFVLALSLTAGAQGAIRWAVGGIDPGSGGFAAGQLPAGAVVGRSSNGHVGWAGICPAAGKPQAVVMLVYALRHPLNLSSGFDPSTVQRQLSANSLGSGVVYGAYKKP